MGSRGGLRWNGCWSITSTMWFPGNAWWRLDRIHSRGAGPQRARPQDGSGEGAAPVIAHFGTLFTTISPIRLLFASGCLYNPARL